jgi:hypothetical protein
MGTRLRALAPGDCPIVALLDGRLLAWGVGWGLVSLVSFGLVSAIIPNPVFGRQIPPEPFAIWVWLLSAPLMGLVIATYTTRPAATEEAAPLLMLDAADPAEVAGRGTTLGMIGSLGAFLAIGCPVCNKIALVLLGASGAMTIFAPIQPYLGAASLALLGATLVWRLRLRARSGACAA